VTFLRIISRTLHGDDPTLPDLGKLERAGSLVMVPIGGGDLLAWAAQQAVERMTVKMLDERDPDGEIRGWLQVIGEMAVG